MSLHTLRNDVNNHPETSVLQSITDMVRKGGLVSPSADFLVGEPAGGGLNVDIATGRAYLKGATTNAYPVWSDEVETVAVNANTSGYSRITSIVLYIDLDEDPDPSGAGVGVAKLMAVDGSPAASPVAPDSSAIQSAVGAGNPFLELARVTVANGASGISEENIENLNKRVFIQSFCPIHPLAFASTVTPDFENSNKQEVTLTGSIIVNAPSNMEVGDTIELAFIQNATGGYDVTWFSGITWLSPDYSLNTDANKKSVFVIEKTGEATYNGYLAGKEY